MSENSVLTDGNHKFLWKLTISGGLWAAALTRRRDIAASDQGIVHLEDTVCSSFIYIEAQ